MSLPGCVKPHKARKRAKPGPLTWLMLPPMERASCGTLRMRGTRYCATSSAGSARQLMKNFAVGVSAPASRAQRPFSDLYIAAGLLRGKDRCLPRIRCARSTRS